MYEDDCSYYDVYNPDIDIKCINYARCRKILIYYNGKYNNYANRIIDIKELINIL